MGGSRWETLGLRGGAGLEPGQLDWGRQLREVGSLSS